jgi:hypothetical protein
MQPDYLCVFYGNHVDTLNIISSLNNINISPVVENESESARLAGFCTFDDKKKIYVHRDEYALAQELIKSLL